jgi:dihydrofolate synthase / folylpolyglutamate synthase
MINTMSELITYFQTKISPIYSRANYDRFLKDHPFQFRIPAIHITGTNGKGSTATFLRNIYQTRFKKVGLFTSPALSRFQEMIYINDDEINDLYILNFFKKWQVQFDAYQLTAFEMQTLLAFHYFHDQGCDFAVIEVGMGGKIDATNIFKPLLSIITNISLEHKAYLGDTVEKIADHKSGIIKEGVPVVVGPLPLGAMQVVEHVARQANSMLTHRQAIDIIEAKPPFVFRYGKHQPFTLTMSANYQIDNAAIAIEAVDQLQARYPIKEVDLQAAVRHTFMPGRLEVIKQQPMVVLDGAHNPGGIKALIQAMTHHHHRSIYVLFAAFKDKDVEPMLEEISKLTKFMFVTTFPHVRARKKNDYPKLQYPFIEDYHQALSVLMKGVPANGVILVTGSLAFIGLVRQTWIP